MKRERDDHERWHCSQRVAQQTKHAAHRRRQVSSGRFIGEKKLNRHHHFLFHAVEQEDTGVDHGQREHEHGAWICSESRLAEHESRKRMAHYAEHHYEHGHTNAYVDCFGEQMGRVGMVSVLFVAHVEVTEIVA